MPAKKAAKTPDSTATPPPPTAKKTTAKKAPVASPVAKKAAKTAAKPQPKTQPTSAATSREEIEKAAYLNYRSRKEKNLPGDAHTDWIEAERKLSAPK
jgi:hypothetical protein